MSEHEPDDVAPRNDAPAQPEHTGTERLAAVPHAVPAPSAGAAPPRPAPEVPAPALPLTESEAGARIDAMLAVSGRSRAQRIPCPPVDRVRAFAEGQEVEAPIGRHVATCGTCLRRVEAARNEEAALRGALPLEPPKDLLARTLSAVAAERSAESAPARRRAAREQQGPPAWFRAAIGLLVLALLLGVGLMVLGRPTATPPPPEPRRPSRPAKEPGEPADAAAEAEADKAAKERVAAQAALEEEMIRRKQELEVEQHAPGREPDDRAEPAEPGDQRVVVEVPPDARQPDPRDPGQEPREPDATPSTTTPARSGAALASVRSGRLEANGVALGPGDAVPAGAQLVAGAGVVLLVALGPDGAPVETSQLFLAARARAQLSAMEQGATGVTLTLADGAAYVDERARCWSIRTADARIDPLGTRYLVQVERGTRVLTLEDAVEVRPSAADDPDAPAMTVVRAGFEVALRSGALREPPRPASAPARALAWLPAASRPPLSAPPEAALGFTFDAGAEGWTKGAPTRRGQRGGCLRGVGPVDTYAVACELERASGVLTLEPDLWLEATVKVDRRARVALQVWDVERKENLALIVTVEAGRWTTIGGALRAFTDPAGDPRAGPVGAGDRGTCLTIFAGEEGETLELLVDDVRAFRPAR